MPNTGATTFTGTINSGEITSTGDITGTNFKTSTTAGNEGGVIVTLTNGQGAIIPANRIVEIDKNTDNAIDLTTTQGDDDVVGITTEACAIGGACKVMILGVTECLFDTGTVLSGRKVGSSSTAGQCDMAYTSAASSDGWIGTTLEAKASGSTGLVKVLINGASYNNN